MAPPTFPVTGDDAADALLLVDPLALLLGMLLDQQIPMEKAFRSPYDLAERMGTDRLDAAAIAAADPEAMVTLFKGPPALHRFPKAFAERAQAVCAAIVADYDGRTEALWADAADGADLLHRLLALPGFGKDKAQIFIALLAKRLGVEPDGWREAAGEFGDGRRLSVADVDSREAFDRVRAWKKEQKAAARARAEAKG